MTTGSTGRGGRCVGLRLCCPSGDGEQAWKAGCGRGVLILARSEVKYVHNLSHP